MFALPVLLIVAILVVFLPFLFGELMFASLSKLHLSPTIAFACVIAIFAGGLINIPVKSVVRDSDVIEDPLAIYGLAARLPAAEVEDAKVATPKQLHNLWPR